MSGIRITVLQTAGSAPREAGTQMMVWADRISGTIGGGALEWQAITRARNMLRNGTDQHRETIPLGPSLGQCCGGSVTLQWETSVAIAPETGRPIWIYGAGHVGRAVVGTLAPLPQFDVTWVDTGPDRFPDAIRADVTQLIAKNPADVVRHAPDDASHLVMTYSHQIDLDICHAILSQEFADAGLIGSATKWARFRKRLAVLGHSQSQILRIACPIGDPSLGKHPQEIAIGVAAALLKTARVAAQRRAG